MSLFHCEFELKQGWAGFGWVACFTLKLNWEREIQYIFDMWIYLFVYVDR